MRTDYNPYQQSSMDELNKILKQMDNYLGLAKLALANYEQYLLDNLQVLCRHHHVDRHLWEAKIAAAKTELVNINAERARKIDLIKKEEMRAIDVQRAEYHAQTKRQRLADKAKLEEAKRREANMSAADRAMLQAQQAMLSKG